MKKIYLILPILILISGSLAFADIWKDTRYFEYGVYATDGWAPGFVISWEIKWVGGSFPWQYYYEIITPKKEISHWIFEISKDANRNDFDFGSIIYEGPKTWEPGPGNPDMPGNIWGIKFDELKGNKNTFTFYSTRAPMWGDFYAKNGKDYGIDVIAYNTEFGKEPMAPYINWIAVPDTVTVPEPGILLLIGLGLTAVGIGSRWMRRK